MKLRRRTYKLGRVLGDVEAIASGKPDKLVKRAANKWIGRNIVRRMWLR